MALRTAVSLLSSGLDSASALALAQAEGTHVVLALTVDYGQRAAAREVAKAAALAAYFRVPHRVVNLPWFRELSGGGALLQETLALPQPDGAALSDLDASTKSAKAVWIPNRNGVLIAVAAAFAEDAGADAVLVGFNREEAATFPDNSVAFLDATNHALRFSTANGVAVVSPTAPSDKKEIVARVNALGFPFEKLWSCYEAGSRMCGRCESCQRLKRALVGNGVRTDDLFDDPVLR